MSGNDHPFIGLQFQTSPQRAAFALAYVSDEPPLRPLLPFDDADEEIYVPRYTFSVSELVELGRYGSFGQGEAAVLNHFRTNSPTLSTFPDLFELRHASHVIAGSTRRGQANRLLVNHYGAMRLYAELGGTQSFVPHPTSTEVQTVLGWDHAGLISPMGIQVHISDAIDADEAFLVYKQDRFDAAAVAYGSLERPIFALNDAGMAKSHDYAFRFQF